MHGIVVFSTFEKERKTKVKIFTPLCLQIFFILRINVIWVRELPFFEYKKVLKDCHISKLGNAYFAGTS